MSRQRCRHAARASGALSSWRTEAWHKGAIVEPAAPALPSQAGSAGYYIEVGPREQSARPRGFANPTVALPKARTRVPRRPNGERPSRRGGMSRWDACPHRPCRGDTRARKSRPRAQGSRHVGARLSTQTSVYLNAPSRTRYLGAASADPGESTRETAALDSTAWDKDREFSQCHSRHRR